MKKRFCDMKIREVVDVLLHDPTIDPDTAKASLARVIPILKHEWLGDIDVLKLFCAGNVRRKDPHYLDWKKFCKDTEKLIKEGEAKLRV